MQDNGSMLKFFSIIHRRAMMYLDRELKGYRIRAGQVPILRILNEENGISQDRIKQLLHMDKGALAKTIKPLINQGYVVRKTNPDDRRAYIVELTESGREIMPGLSALIDRWIESITKGMTQAEKARAFKLLSRMSENAFNFFERRR